MEDFADARRKMVDSQLRTEGVTDRDLLAAMGAVPRELFVAPGQRPLAYVDSDIPMREALDAATPRYLMRPAPFARMVQLAALTPDDRVLVVGCGTGYPAAVVARLAGSVVALESDPALAQNAARNFTDLQIGNIDLVVGPLDAGHAAGGPYDAIIVDGAVESLPDPLLEQIAEGGRLVAVVGYGRTGAATLYTRSDGQIGRRQAFDAVVPPLPGFRNPEVFVF